MKLWRAVVEDNKDPLEISRVRVRIYGIHTPDNENISGKFNVVKSSELPWAEIMGGTDFGLLGGIGLSTVLQQGTWVWVMLDHDNPNMPIVVGTIKGTVKSRPSYASGEGFNDKDDVYPLKARYNEPDLNRLTRNKKLQDPAYDTPIGVYSSIDTIHKQINDNLDVISVIDSVSGSNVSQTEPNSTNNSSVYPEVAVLETASGHCVELDDSPNNERMRFYHKSGSYIEMKPDGSIVRKTVGGTDHYISMGDVQEHVAKGVKTYIENNLEEIIEGGIKQHVNMDLFKHVGGFFKITADGNLEIVNDVKITGSLEVSSKGTFGADLTSKAEVADASGNMSSLRGAHDSHKHTGNLGIPTTAPKMPDPKTRAADYMWSSTPKGFV